MSTLSSSVPSPILLSSLFPTAAAIAISVSLGVFLTVVVVVVALVACYRIKLHSRRRDQGSDQTSMTSLQELAVEETHAVGATRMEVPQDENAENLERG